MFKLLQDGKSISKYQISISIVEVYKENRRDLLTSAKAKNRKRLEIFQQEKTMFIDVH